MESSTGTLTVRTMFADGRVTANLNIPGEPPTWIQVFGSIQDAEVYAEDHDLEFIDECTPLADET